MPTKLYFKQAVKTLGKGWNKRNLLDEVEEKHIAMYVDWVTWKYTEHDITPYQNNEISIYLSSRNISSYIRNYQATHYDAINIKQRLISGDDTFFIIAPEEKTKTFNKLKRAFKDKITKSFRIMLSDLFMKQLKMNGSDVTKTLSGKWKVLQKLIKHSEDHEIKIDSISNDLFYWECKIRYFLPIPLRERKELEGILSELKASYDELHWEKEELSPQKSETIITPLKFKLDENKDEYLNIYSSWIAIHPTPKGFSLPVNFDNLFFLESDIEKLTKNTLTDKIKLCTANKVHRNTEINAQKRAKILGSALSVLVNFPETCKSKGGKVQASKIARYIDDNSFKYFDGDAPLGIDKSTELIREWIKKTSQ